MTTNGDLGVRVREIRAIARSFRIPDILRFTLSAPRMVNELLEAMDREAAYHGEQLRRRDQDLAEIRGRRSVEIEAAGREGYRQGNDDGLDPARQEGLNLRLVYAAALNAIPTEVTAELKMVSRSRAGA